MSVLREGVASLVISFDSLLFGALNPDPGCFLEDDEDDEATRDISLGLSLPFLDTLLDSSFAMIPPLAFALLAATFSLSFSR